MKKNVSPFLQSEMDGGGAISFTYWILAGMSELSLIRRTPSVVLLLTKPYSSHVRLSKGEAVTEISQFKILSFSNHCPVLDLKFTGP